MHRGNWANRLEFKKHASQNTPERGPGESMEIDTKVLSQRADTEGTVTASVSAERAAVVAAATPPSRPHPSVLPAVSLVL
mmetsp:Transcript_5417/g.12404  ORF Transcript_5417/g.12404 Transcript_5417/m.12404 type:complete len:80 (-) Transcript_5417:1067-1306(-)